MARSESTANAQLAQIARYVGEFGWHVPSANDLRVTERKDHA